jgi:abhydrolase domain-containing protein 6
VILVGNSLGGMISAETAARYPGRVAKLLLLDAAGISTSNPVYGARIGLQLATLQSVRLIQTLSRVTGARTGHPLRLAVAHPRRLERGLLRAAFLPGSGKPGFGFVVLDAMLTVGNRGSRQRLAAIDVPTLIVWGADDRLLPVGDADVFAELIAGSETVILPDTGHCPMLERPREFNHLLMEFAER